ncbi:hypothetical protein BGW37DRAFT_506918 [Umbelopsis sp. PMI_123]|nr:hypothetical protein BGW37DRAFT_506918 [Umbelopsis sp. PMI_123]
MALHVWTTLTDNQSATIASSTDRFNAPFLSPPSAIHYSLLGFRGSSAPAVLYRQAKHSSRNTFGYFRSCKVRPASSFAENGPHSQRIWKSDHDSRLVVVDKYCQTPTSYEHNSGVITSGVSAQDKHVIDLSIGEPYHCDSQKKLSQPLTNVKTISPSSNIKDTEITEDEKSYKSLRESQPSEEGQPNLHSAQISYEPSRPWSFPYFLPMPLKRVLNRHTWTETDCDDQDSVEEICSQHSSSRQSMDSQHILRDIAEPYADVQQGSVVEAWRSSFDETSPAPSSTRIVAGMRHMVPTVSSLSVSEASGPILQGSRNILSSHQQMADINAIEKGYIYNPTPSEHGFWNIQTVLFLFGFLAFPCWWIGAFASSDPKILKEYNLRSNIDNRDHLNYGTTSRHIPPSDCPVTIPIQPQRIASKPTMKRNFQQLNRVMTVVSFVVVLLVAGLLIWYKLGIAT